MALNHQHLEFRETPREKSKDGTPLYDAAGYIGWDEPTKVEGGGKFSPFARTTLTRVK
jgi:hypothetical protein